jgi:hypothetical protein
MSTDELSSAARAAKVNPATTDSSGDDASALQDVLAQKTLAMLGGAPQPEVDRLATTEKANLDQLLASSPDADEGTGGVTPSVATQNGPGGDQTPSSGPDWQNSSDASSNSGGGASPDAMADEPSAAALRELEALRDIVLADSVKRYPDLGNRDSALWKVAAQMAREAHDPNHPDHLAGQHVEAPRYFAEKAAALLNLRPGANRSGAGQTSGMPVSPLASVAGRSGPRPGPASGSKQTSPPARSLSDQQKIAAAHARTLSLIGGKSGGGYDDDPTNAVLVM